ncbi:hypothetical protein HZB02_04405 [Candidatus Woesearchaeota archaeon]|nr:hypothetical protein [Candidatus Woesearchaeota archaeon]
MVNLGALLFGTSESQTYSRLQGQLKEVLQIIQRMEYEASEESDAVTQWEELWERIDIQKLEQNIKHTKMLLQQFGEDCAHLAKVLILIQANLKKLEPSNVGEKIEQLKREKDQHFDKLLLWLEHVKKNWMQQAQFFDQHKDITEDVKQNPELKKLVKNEYQLLQTIKELLYPLSLKTNYLVKAYEDVSFLEYIKPDAQPPEIPEGWTYLVHGTNLLRPAWDYKIIQLFQKPTLKVQRMGLSAVTREEQQQENQEGNYNTTRLYSKFAQPKEMHDEEYRWRNRPLQIRVIFFLDYLHNQRYRPYLNSLFQEQDRQEVKDIIVKYYEPRHPIVPSGTPLVKVAHTLEDDVHVLYYIPRQILHFYREQLVTSSRPSRIVVDS